MSWLGVEADADTALERVLGLLPDAQLAVRKFYSVFWTDGLLDPRLLELIRLRIARLYSCESELLLRYEAAVGMEDQIAALGEWPSSPLFSDLERACLRVAEQFVIDSHGITDADVAPISSTLGSPGLVAVMNAIALFDYLGRIRAIFDVAPASENVLDVPSPSATAPIY